MVRIGNQDVLQCKDVPTKRFFVCATRANAHPDRWFRQFFVAIADEDLPPDMQEGADSVALFHVVGFQPRNGQSAIVWLRETNEVDEEECVIAVTLAPFIVNGADVHILPEGAKEAPATLPKPVFQIPSSQRRKRRGGRGHSRGSNHESLHR